MHKLPFWIGTFVSWFVLGRERRRKVRGAINRFFFYVPIARFIKQTYGVRVRKIRFVRQISMKRMTCVVNDKYYVKVFRFVSIQRLNDYKFLMNFIRSHLPVKIPEIFVSKHIPMYVAEKLPGTDMRDFDKSSLIKNEKQIKQQVLNVIQALRDIDVMTIPDNQRFLTNVQSRTQSYGSVTKKSVLAHCDLNPSNVRLDKGFNVVSIIDWDSMQIVQNKNTDIDGFDRLWKIFKHTK